MDTVIDSIDVPQQDDLSKVRAVVRELRGGASKADLSDKVALSGRHVRYTLHAARTLGLTRQIGEEWSTTDSAGELLGYPEGSGAEREWLQARIAGNATLTALAPTLLTGDAPTVEGLAERLSTMTGLSASTAYRRAITLLSWREQVWTPPPPEGIDPAQMSLF